MRKISRQLIVVFLLFISLNSQIYAQQCVNGTTSFTWEGAGTGNEAVWNPDDVSNNYTNISGSGIDVGVDLSDPFGQNTDTGNPSTFNDYTESDSFFGPGALSFQITSTAVNQDVCFTFTFSEPAFLDNYTVFDIDASAAFNSASSYQDQVEFSATGPGGSTVPLTLSTVGALPNYTISGQTAIAIYPAAGTTTDVTETDPNGAVTVTNSSPISTFTVCYDNGPADDGLSDDHAIRLPGFTFCPAVGAVSGTVTDTNGTGLVGVAITLQNPDGTTATDINGNPLTTTTSDGTTDVDGDGMIDLAGSYFFGDVLAGNYNVIETQPTGYGDDSEADGGDDGDNPDNGIVNSIPVTVDAGETDTGNNFVDSTGSISGTLWNDVNANGINDGESGLLGVTVRLLDSLGNVVTTATTLGDGSYTFPDLLAGNYSIEVDTSTLPTGSNVADPSQTGDPDETGGVCAICDSLTTTPISLTGGQDVTAIDFGYTGDSLPVTLSSVLSEWSGSKLKVDWSTSSELFNVGFQLWGLDSTDQKWEKLHGWLVRSGSGNAVEPQSYSKTVNLPASINELAALGISSVDSDGSEHYYGPFDVGQSYGNLSTMKPIAWNHIRAQVDAQMASRGYVKDRVNGYHKVRAQSSSTSTTDSVIELGVRESGMYRITAQALLKAGIDWREIAKRDIALVDHNGNAVVRYVLARGSRSGSTKTLGSNGEIYFYSTGVDAQAGLYTQTRVYRLVNDRYRALSGQYQRKQGIRAGFSDYYMETARVENDVHYELTSAADDPWVEAVVVSYPYRSGSYAAGIPVEDDALWSHPATLRLDLARNSRLRVVGGNGSAGREHVVEGQVLSSQGTGGLLALGTEQAVGKGDWSVEFKIPADTPVTLIKGKAVVGGIFSAGAGYKFSEVHVDGASLSYARPYVAKADDDYLSFSGPNTGESGYSVTVPDNGWPVAFAYNDAGGLVHLGLESQAKVTASDGSRQRQVNLSRLNGAGTQASPTQYWVSGRRGYLSVESLAVKSLASTSSLLAQAAGSNYLLIAHPMFTGPALDTYANFKQSQGYRVSIVDYLQIVDVFGGGQTGPHGLTAYLKQVAAQGNLEHVLLVGGSSYDHTDKLGAGAMTFIPGHYGQSNYSKFTVSDVPYITNADNDLFASIGRWPVRSVSDLQTIVDKSMAFSEADHSAGHVLSIAEHTVANENIDFAAALNTMAPLVPPSWTRSEVHVDKVATANNLSLPKDLPQALSLAKTEIITELNKAPDVVLYNGHGTTSQLSNKGLFKSSDVTKVTAPGAEMWLPMSCYVTYFESTHMNTLAHQLMFKSNAVAISGAMLLSSQSENLSMGSSILDRTLNQGQSLGAAVNQVKTEQANTQLNINWNTLGDPSLRF